jgi:uroporphyrinogen-III synthase
VSLPLLVLRPEPGASATARRAEEHGLHPIRYPLFEVHATAWDAPDPDGFDAMLLTSANTLRCAGPQLDLYRHLPVFAVGETTAEAARARGFSIAAVGHAGAQAISEIIAARGHGRVFHPGGRDRREFNPGPLSIIRRCVYESVEAGTAEGLAAVMPREAVALLHSPRGAVRLAKLVPMIERQRLHLAAVSSAVLDAAGAGWASGEAAPMPKDEALLVLAAALCK